MKKVAVLGSGQVGEALANGFLKHGYAVMRATRDPEKLEAWKSGAKGEASVGTFAEAAKWGEIDRARGQGHASPRRRSSSRHREPRRQDGHRHDEPDRRRAARQRRDPLLHERERVADGASAEEGAAGEASSRRSTRSATRSWSTRSSQTTPTMFICGNDAGAKHETTEILDEVRLGDGRHGRASRPRARSSRSACCGASRASCATTGRTRSST